MDKIKTFIRAFEVESYGRELRPVESMVFANACKIVDGGIKASPKNVSRILADIRMIGR